MLYVNVFSDIISAWQSMSEGSCDTLNGLCSGGVSVAPSLQTRGLCWRTAIGAGGNAPPSQPEAGKAGGGAPRWQQSCGDEGQVSGRQQVGGGRPLQTPDARMLGGSVLRPVSRRQSERGLVLSLLTAFTFS